jgi:acetyl-CoA acetyltransferase
MSLRGVAAVVGIAERAPQRYTGGETDLDLLSGVAVDALADAGIDRGQVDGLLVHPLGGLPGFVPATVAEFVGLRPRFAEVVDLGGATGAGMVWRAAAAIGAGMCSTCLCLTGTRRRRPRRSSGRSDGAAPTPRSFEATRDRSPSSTRPTG